MYAWYVGSWGMSGGLKNGLNLTDFENMGVWVQLYFCNQYRGFGVFLHNFTLISFNRMRKCGLICTAVDSSHNLHS